jgi:hypothetical protein
MHLLDIKPARFLASLLFPQPEPSASLSGGTNPLSSLEARFFQENGYLARSGALPPEICSAMVDVAWKLYPPTFRRDQPATWKGKVKDCLSERTLRQRKGRLKFRECIRPEKWMLHRIRSEPSLSLTASALLGSGREPFIPYLRGIYPVFPGAFSPFKKPRPHLDGHPFVLGMLLYLEDVLPGGGGFHVWPGSHLELRHAFQHAAGPERRPSYHRSLYGYALKHAAQEITGPAGTVIFWHHRLAHAAGLNRSNRIRHALLADYRTADMDELMQSPVPEDPWSGWAFQTHPDPAALTAGAGIAESVHSRSFSVLDPTA